MDTRAFFPRLMLAVMAAFLAAAGCTTQPPPARQALRISGWIHTEGTTLRDERDSPTRLLSVNVPGMQSGAGDPNSPALIATGCRGWTMPSAEAFDRIASWGFNSVRLPISWANLEPEPPNSLPNGTPVHRYNDSYEDAIATIVREFAERGVPVILDMAQYDWSPAFKQVPAGGGQVLCQGIGMPVWLYPNAGSLSVAQARCDFYADRPEPGVPVPSLHEALRDAWVHLLGRYVDDSSVIGVDLLNEPFGARQCSRGSGGLGTFYQTAGAAVRDLNPHLLLVFQDTRNRATGSFGLDAPVPLPNAVYSFHLYAADWNPSGLERTQAYLDRARAWDVPLWIGEFDRFGGFQAVVPDWATQMEEMLTFCRQQDISWAYWAYTGSDPLVDREGQINTELVETLQSGF
jgi:hypothetical protein